MSNDKPREFWIIDESPFSTWVSSKPLNSADTKEEIHVIERKAYDQVCAELELLKTTQPAVLAVAIESREAEIKKLREALAFYADRKNWRASDSGAFVEIDCEDTDFTNSDHYEHGGRRAREALGESK